MQDAEPRYAIYFVSAASSALHRFGSAVLGYDCIAGADVAPPADLAVDAEEWRALTEDPRRYGFHATLKAPFRLAPDGTETELANTFLEFARLAREVAHIEPEVRLLGGFTAVVPRTPSAAVVALANQCTMVFDMFRAPMDAAERERRIAAGLSERQIQNLDQWGYPYLFDDFRFHMTLTNRIPLDRRDEVVMLLRRNFARACGDRPIAVDRLALLRQDDAQARFRVIRHAELRTS